MAKRRTKTTSTAATDPRPAKLEQELQDASEHGWAKTMRQITAPPTSAEVEAAGGWAAWADAAQARGEIDLDTAETIKDGWSYGGEVIVLPEVSRLTHKTEGHLDRLQQTLRLALGRLLVQEPATAAREIQRAIYLAEQARHDLREAVAAALTPKRVEGEKKRIGHAGEAQAAVAWIAEKDERTTERPWRSPAEMHDAFRRHSSKIDPNKAAKKVAGVWTGSYRVDGVSVGASSIDGAARTLKLLCGKRARGER